MTRQQAVEAAAAELGIDNETLVGPLTEASAMFPGVANTEIPPDEERLHIDLIKRLMLAAKDPKVCKLMKERAAKAAEELSNNN